MSPPTGRVQYDSDYDSESGDYSHDNDQPSVATPAKVGPVGKPADHGTASKPIQAKTSAVATGSTTTTTTTTTTATVANKTQSELSETQHVEDDEGEEESVTEESEEISRPADSSKSLPSSQKPSSEKGHPEKQPRTHPVVQSQRGEPTGGNSQPATVVPSDSDSAIESDPESPREKADVINRGGGSSMVLDSDNEDETKETGAEEAPQPTLQQQKKKMITVGLEKDGRNKPVSNPPKTPKVGLSPPSSKKTPATQKQPPAVSTETEKSPTAVTTIATKSVPQARQKGLITTTTTTATGNAPSSPRKRKHRDADTNETSRVAKLENEVSLLREKQQKDIEALKQVFKRNLGAMLADLTSPPIRIDGDESEGESEKDAVATPPVRTVPVKQEPKPRQKRNADEQTAPSSKPTPDTKKANTNSTEPVSTKRPPKDWDLIDKNYEKQLWDVPKEYWELAKHRALSAFKRDKRFVELCQKVARAKGYKFDIQPVDEGNKADRDRYQYDLHKSPSGDQIPVVFVGEPTTINTKNEERKEGLKGNNPFAPKREWFHTGKPRSRAKSSPQTPSSPRKTSKTPNETKPRKSHPVIPNEAETSDSDEENLEKDDSDFEEEEANRQTTTVMKKDNTQPDHRKGTSSNSPKKSNATKKRTHRDQENDDDDEEEIIDGDEADQSFDGSEKQKQQRRRAAQPPQKRRKVTKEKEIVSVVVKSPKKQRSSKPQTPVLSDNEEDHWD